jgi:hypothetical protein
MGTYPGHYGIVKNKQQACLVYSDFEMMYMLILQYNLALLDNQRTIIKINALISG